MSPLKIFGYAIGPIGSALLAFVSLPIITWFYSIEDIGRIAMLQVASSFCVLLFCLGLDQAYVREYHEEKNRPALLQHSLLPGILLLVLCCLLVAAYDSSILSRLMYSEKSSLLSYLTMGCFAFALISRFLSLILRMQEKALAFSMTQVLPKALFLSVIGGCVLLAIPASFYTLISAHAVSILAVMLIAAWSTRQDWLDGFKQPLVKARLHHLLQYGLPLVVGGLASWGLNVMDKLFLRAMSSFAELGIYSVASSIAAGAGIFASIFTTIWAPTVFKWAAEGINPERIDKISEHVLAAAFFIFVLTGLFSWILPYLLPETYAVVQYLITACIAAPLFYALSETTAIGISISRKTGYSMLASIIAAIVNFAGNYWLVPLYGSTGAAVSTAFAFWIFLICRTELSCLVWRSIPRSKLYITTLICLLSSTTPLLVGSTSTLLTATIWATSGVLAIFIFKNSLHTAHIELKKALSITSSKTGKKT